MKLFRICYGLGIILCALVSTVQAEPILTIAAWGGTYEAAQRTAIFTPFETEKNIRIKTVPYSGGIDVLNQTPLPDIVDMPEADARVACENGELVELNMDTLLEQPVDGGDLEDDFLDDALLPCSVAHPTYSTLIAYNSDAFSGEHPQRIADFFDLEKFPGKRGVYRQPEVILEWALMAEGVPLEQIYDLLSTERGMELALKRLQSIRDHIVWWQEADEPVKLLASQEVVMSAGFNGRFFAAQTSGASISMIWDGQIIDRGTWVIPKKIAENNKNLALDFIHFATTPHHLASFSELFPYGPTRFSALRRVGLHPTLDVPMSDHLPTAEHHLKRALFRDANWYANTTKLREQRFDDWLLDK